jgi:PAS domain S-box-containing protein
VRNRVLIGIIVLLALLEAGLVYFGHRLVEDSVYSHYLEMEKNTSYMSVVTFETILNTTIRQMKMLADDPDIILMTPAGKSKLSNVPSMIGEAVGSVNRLDREFRIIYTYPTNDAVIGVNVSEGEHNIELRRTREPVLGEPFRAVHGYYALPVVQPVFRSGSFDGALNILLKMSWLNSVFWDPVSKQDEEGVAALLSEDGRVLWCQGPLKPDIRFDEETMRVSGGKAISDLISDPGFRSPVALHTRLPGLEERWIVGITPIAVAGKHWFLVSGISDDALSGALARYRGMILMGALVVVLLGVLLALFLAGARRQYIVAEERASLADKFESDLLQRTEELAYAKQQLEQHARGLEQKVEHSAKQLVESEIFYRQIVDNVETIIFLIDKGKLVFANPAFARSLTVDSASGYRGSEFLNLVNEDSRQVFLGALAKLSEGRTSTDLNQLEVVTESGDIRIWNGSVKRLETWDPQRFMGFFRDVTEQKHMEQQVLQSQKLESVGRLAGGVAHDFNNILAGIFGNLALLREQFRFDASEEETTKLIDTIDTAARRAADLTRKLLFFSRKETEDRKLIDLKQAIDEVGALLRTTMGESIDYQVSVCDEDLRVLANSTELQQVLLNLCINALEAMPGGGLLQVLAARAKAGDDANLSLSVPADTEFARIRVTDTGSGINPSVMDKIFEPFFTTKPMGKGTGLGLSIAYHVINKQGGTIVVDSDWGRGSVFSVYLPLATETGEAVEAAGTYVYPDFAGAAPMLVVDDEEMITSPVKRFFERYNLTVHVANDGVEAIEEFKKRQHEIGLVLIDNRMPKLSGIEAFSIIHQLNPSAIGVLMTGFGEDLRSSEYLRLGFSEVMQKPFSFEDLAKTLERYLL